MALTHGPFLDMQGTEQKYPEIKRKQETDGKQAKSDCRGQGPAERGEEPAERTAQQEQTAERDHRRGRGQL